PRARDQLLRSTPAPTGGWSQRIEPPPIPERFNLQECVVDLYWCVRADCTFHCVLLPSLFGLGGHLANEFRNGSAGLVDHTAEDPVVSGQRARKSAQFRSYVHRAILYWASPDPATAVQRRAIGR
ncbi:hypothetical protein ACFYYQ_29380, partial [Streptomyces albidoflavus]